MASLGALIAVILGTLAALSGQHAALAGDCVPGPGTPAIVAAVTGAATVRLETGETLLLAGIVAPQSGSVPDEAWPPRAAMRLELEKLVSGKSVVLSGDGRRTDRYGNLVAQVFVTSESDAQPGADKSREWSWVEGELIASGQARAAAMGTSDPCLDDMLALESAARGDRRGNWATGIFADRDAGDLFALRRLRDTFQSVTGTLERIDTTHPAAALVLGGDTTSPARTRTTAGSGDAFRVELAPGAGSGRNARRLSGFEGAVGRRVRVRGWIEGRSRPYLVVADPRLIEIVGGEPPVAGPK